MEAIPSRPRALQPKVKGGVILAGGQAEDCAQLPSATRRHSRGPSL